jgi:hypothetical protein
MGICIIMQLEVAASVGAGNPTSTPLAKANVAGNLLRSNVTLSICSNVTLSNCRTVAYTLMVGFSRAAIVGSWPFPASIVIQRADS